MRCAVFGLDLELALPLPSLRWPHPAAAGPRLTVTDGPPDGWSGPAGPRTDRVVDGLPFTAERGTDGDLLLRWGEVATFHLSADGATLRADGLRDARGRRVLLDSALGSAALSLGREALHGGAVVVGGEAVAVLAGTGGGKTSTLLELVAAGHPLLADDVLVVDGDGLAHPAPPVVNAALDRPPSAADLSTLGTVLAELDGEAWLAVDAVAPAPAPLRTVVELHRVPGAELRVEPLPAGPLTVLPHLLASGEAPERRLARFDLAATLGERTTAVRIIAPTAASPAALAQLVLDHHRTPAPT